MKTLAFPLLFTVAAIFGCNKLNQKIEVDQTTFFSVPKIVEFIVKDSTNFLKIWESSIEDDRLTVFKYSINQGDTLNTATLRTNFTKNVDEFLKPFDLEGIDSTFTFKEEYFQNNLTFDYMSKGEKHKFFGKFVENRQSFIAFCFQTPIPIDKNSKSLKDKIFNSIEVR